MVRLPNEQNNGPMDKAAQRLRQFEQARGRPTDESGPQEDGPEKCRKPAPEPDNDVRPHPPDSTAFPDDMPEDR